MRTSIDLCGVAKTIASMFNAARQKGVAPKVVMEKEVVGCEHCERVLEEWELFEEGEGRCAGCGMRVCREGGCSIEYTGREGRVCLDCAQR